MFITPRRTSANAAGHGLRITTPNIVSGIRTVNAASMWGNSATALADILATWISPKAPSSSPNQTFQLRRCDGNFLFPSSVLVVIAKH